MFGSASSPQSSGRHRVVLKSAEHGSVGPGEDSLSVMTYDRSIEMDSELYRAFVPYALIMLLIYPIGMPLQVASFNATIQIASAVVA